jgi:hypothetical protein
MFKVRKLKEDDYEELVGWWKANRFSPPPQDHLPERGACGLMIYKDNINICAGFLYFTNSKICHLEFIVANFYYREKDRPEAIQTVITELTDLARRKGFKTVFTSLKNENLIKHYEQCGYIKGSKGTTEMIINL